MKELGEKIKILRKQSRMTLQELSDRSHVSKSLLSQIERGISVPTVTKLQKIAQALRLNMSELFLEIETDRNHNGDGLSVLAADESNLPIVVRKRQRKKMITPWGAVHEMLSPDLQHKIEFILIQQPVGTRVSELYAHEGEECGLVLEGRFKGIFGEHEFILEPGDSIYYDSSIPHRWENGGDVEVKAIWAITPPSF
jgi:transcriptional regulator with XRE-family HTH domain